VLAVAAAAAVVLTGPLIGGIRSWMRRTFSGEYQLLINVGLALVVAVGIAAAIRRIRPARLARYSALAAALAVAATFAWITRSGNPDVDAVERFHFVEFGAVTWLFYRAWRHHRDLATLALPVLATFVTGVADEAFQWFVPGRVGEWRDVGINLAAIAGGLLFSVAVDPPSGIQWRVVRASRRPLGITLAATALVIAGFLHLVHAGVVVRDVEVGDFTSRYDEATLLALARDRHERWRTDPPPLSLVRYSREDQYRTEGVLRIRRRNACWALNGRSAWRENVILEKFYGPVLDTPAWDTPDVSRWPPEQRSDLARRIGTVPLRGPCNPEVPEPWLFLWSPRWLWIGAGVVAALGLWLARRR
jgi:VanZ family protein